jgi:phage recombination protein Bet
MNTDTALVTSAVDPSVAGAIAVYERLNPVRDILAADLTDSELTLFAMVAQRSGLDPFAKQIYAIKRAGRVTFQTGIDGYRSIAARTGQYEGSEEPEFGPWIDSPFRHPEWCRVTVYRWQNGHRVEQPGIAWWDEYYPGTPKGVPSGPKDTGYMWLTKPRVMISKVAEAIGLRKAFPYLLADIYVREEMESAGPAENPAAAAAAAQPTARERLAARRAALEQPSDAAPVEPVATPPAEEGQFRDADTADEPAEAPGPNLTGCEWRLGQGSGKPTLRCGMELGPDGTHEGEHSWQPVAMTTGGRVMKPGAS